MLQVSFIAYSTAGAFLNLASFDLYWQYVVFTVILRQLVAKHLVDHPEPGTVPAQADTSQGMVNTPNSQTSRGGASGHLIQRR